MRLALLLVLLGGFGYAQHADTAQTIPDTLLFRIQQAQAAITDVNAVNKKGYHLDALLAEVSEIKQDIGPLQAYFKRHRQQSETRNLLSYALILKNAGQRLARLKEVLIRHSSALQQMSDRVIGLSNDSVLAVTDIDRKKRHYQPQLAEIRRRLQQTGKTTGANLDQVAGLLAEVSALDIVVNDLMTQVTEGLKQSGEEAFGREVPLLWHSSWQGSSGGNIWEQIRDAYRSHRQILSYFFNNSWDQRVWAVLIAAAFFLWVNRNFRLAKRPAVRLKTGKLSFRYLKLFFLPAAILAGLNIAPVVEQGAPPLYIELLQFLQLLLIIFYLRQTLSARQIRSCLWLVSAFALLIIVGAVNSDGLFFRVVLMVLNVFFVITGWRMLQKTRIPQFSVKYVKGVILFFMASNTLAVFLNIFGRLSLAIAIGSAGVVGLVQLIGLAVFVQIMLDALELQLKISACSKGLFSRVDHARTRNSTKKILQLTAIFLWLAVFLLNLNLTAPLMRFLENVLSRERAFGSIHFTLGNILFFLFIIYLANKLQKSVPILFGEGNLSYEGEVEQKSSKVALIRLIIIVVALLLALTASGLPMDRVTVVLGALGVGIGLGMQNIVNNFVSGIILIFERPFRIGDFVELADKKGRVKDIGIRSSKLLTQQGAEVIIPNGDLLSGRLVNWTLNHDYVKTELLFKVSADTDLKQLKKVIDEEAARTPHGMKGLQTEMLIQTLLAGAVEIKVLAWVENIYAEPSFRSELMARLLKKFNTLKIIVV